MKKRLLTMVLAMMSASLPAQQPQPAGGPAAVAFTANGQQINNAPGREISLADFNGDGKLDAFIVNQNEYYVYFGDGRGNLNDSGQKLTCPSGWTSPAVGDVNGDGRLDVVTGKTAWINDGKGMFTAQNDAVQTAESGNITGQLADLNGDGRLDFFAIEKNAVVRVYLNDGKGRFADSGQRLGDGAIGKGQIALIALDDVDGNGTVDAVTAGWRWEGSTECPNRVWLNDGKGNFRDSGQLLDEKGSHVHGLALADVNGDGKLDLIMGIQDPNRGGRVYLNDGKGQFTGAKNLPGRGANNIAMADFDGDGKLDVFITCSRQPNVVGLNDGAGNFRDGGVKLGPKDVWSWDVATGDLNGDARQDAVVVTCQNFMNPAPAQVWLNSKMASRNAGDSKK